MNTQIEPTGQLLIDRWDSRHGHSRQDACPGCGASVATIGITKLVYTFEVCSCGSPDYDHLLETVWHRVCLPPTPCVEFRPFRVRGRKGVPAHDTLECYECGRLAEAHTA